MVNLAALLAVSPVNDELRRFPWQVALLWVITLGSYQRGASSSPLVQTPSHPATYCCFLQYQLNRWRDSNHHSLNGVHSPQ